MPGIDARRRSSPIALLAATPIDPSHRPRGTSEGADLNHSTAFDRSAPGLTANELRRMVCTHATVYAPVPRPVAVSSSFPDQSHCRMHAVARGMEPLTIDRTHILVLNYNGRGLLAECLPSIVEAAAAIAGPLPRDRRRQRLDGRLGRAGRKSLADCRLRPRGRTSGSPRSTGCSSGSTSRSSCC